MIPARYGKFKNRINRSDTYIHCVARLSVRSSHRPACQQCKLSEWRNNKSFRRRQSSLHQILSDKMHNSRPAKHTQLGDGGCLGGASESRLSVEMSRHLASSDAYADWENDDLTIMVRTRPERMRPVHARHVVGLFARCRGLYTISCLDMGSKSFGSV